MSSNKTPGRKHFAFEIVQDRRQGTSQTAARFTCGCGAHHQITFVGSTNPEFVERKFREAGWEVDAWNASRVRCPMCLRDIAARRRAHDPDIELKKRGLLLPAAPSTETQTMSRTDQDGAPVALTPEQRSRVRSFLDKYFDDKSGQYLDGYSDHRIGEETRLPRASVRALREAAYGPLRADPAIEEARALLVQAEGNAKTARHAADNAEQIVASAREKLAAVEKRLGIAP